MINEMGRTRLDVNVKIKSNVDEKLFALNLVVTIPMPPHTARAELQTSQGKLCQFSRLQAASQGHWGSQGALAGQGRWVTSTCSCTVACQDHWAGFVACDAVHVHVYGVL